MICKKITKSCCIVQENVDKTDKNDEHQDNCRYKKRNNKDTMVLKEKIQAKSINRQ